MISPIATVLVIVVKKICSLFFSRAMKRKLVFPAPSG